MKEMENMKQLFDEFISESEKFIERYKENEKKIGINIYGEK